MRIFESASRSLLPSRDSTSSRVDNILSQEYFRHINAMNLRNPRMIGFGISNKQTLESAQNNAAGAIIGSKFVTLLNESKNADEALDKLFEALKR